MISGTSIVGVQILIDQNNNHSPSAAEVGGSLQEAFAASLIPVQSNAVCLVELCRVRCGLTFAHSATCHWWSSLASATCDRTLREVSKLDKTCRGIIWNVIFRHCVAHFQVRSGSREPMMNGDEFEQSCVVRCQRHVYEIQP